MPLALLNEPWLANRRIVMLEPRRLATRAAAHRMAQTLGESVGKTVGYRVRRDSRVSAATRVEVVTEGILSRFLQDDPALEDVGLVIFDEFHERSLHADLGLALTLQTQSLLREDLRVLVMSATLDGQAVAGLLGDAPVISTEGRSFPVETRYVESARPRADRRIEPFVASAIAEALRTEAGDILVFLPGAGEIRRVESLLRERAGEMGPGVTVAPLYGNLPQDAQDRAILPSPGGQRRVVLSTSIAETSLTIEGVRIVIDAGLARVPRFSPLSGMARLETVRVSRASADQRRGRAGRVAPGICIRLWPELEQQQLVPHATPEILEADLAPLALELASAGVADPLSLRWLDPPPAAALSQARELLLELEAIDGSGRITSHGKRVAKLALHPRLAHMLLRAEALGSGALACELAALLEERDVLRGDAGAPDADLRLRLDALRGRGSSANVDHDAVRRVRGEAEQLMRQLRVSTRSGESGSDTELSGLLLAFAYPDRIGQRRSGQPGRFLLRNGRGAALLGRQAISESAFIVAAALDDQRPESRIFLAAPLAADDVTEHFATQIEREDIVEWDPASQAVLARRRERLGAIVLRDAPLRDADPDAVARALVDGLARDGANALPWTDAARRIQQRIAFVRAHDASLPDVSDERLSSTMTEWLPSRIIGMRRRDDLQRVDLSDVLLAMLGWEQRKALEDLAPTHVTVPSGSRLPIDYSDPASPALAVRLQEMFGLEDTPRIARGRVPLTLHLLSPAHRPVQVTKDLAGFWRGSYFDVKKDLRGRYPKHHWPDDPLQAEPTNRAKRKK